MAVESAPPDTAATTGVPGAGKRHRASNPRSAVVDVTRRERAVAHESQQFGNRLHAELAADPAQAGVDVRTAHTEVGRGIAHRGGAGELFQQLALLAGERA